VIRIHHRRVQGNDITLFGQIQAFFSGVFHRVLGITRSLVENPKAQLPRVGRGGVEKLCPEGRKIREEDEAAAERDEGTEGAEGSRERKRDRVVGFRKGNPWTGNATFSRKA
jgi:hypothetical protein